DAGGNLDAELLHASLHAGTRARGTRVRDDGALPVAVTARLRDREEGLLKTALPGAVALRARARRRPRLGAAAVARAARHEARNRDRLLAAERGLLEGDLELVAEVLTASRPPATATPT